ncbi:MAG TPA: DUF5667 domain-containing protein [Dehalococcoidia bacterium]|nr:DUF5667 domain-containing protein [Dehalococcoidia bacterium]
MKFEKGEQTELKKFEDILVQCIEDIKTGRSSIEDCLDKYPSMREQLEPLLKIALGIRKPPDVKPSSVFKVKARVWLMDQIYGGQPVAKWPWSRYDSRVKPIHYIRRFSMSMASVILVIVIALSALGAGTVYAAQSSLPGDTLYPVKLATEQAGMILVRDDVARAERALSFADKRVREMVALAQKGRAQDMDLAVQQYGYALNVTLAETEQAHNRGLDTGNVTARVAEATSRHLLVLDEVCDMVPDQAKAAIAHARNVSETGYFHALAALAKNNTVMAAQINLAAMEGRLNRVRARVSNMEAVQIALQQFEAMAQFGEEISQIAHEVDKDVEMVEELIALATTAHLEELAEVWEMVPEQAKPAIERAMANLLIRHQKRVQALEQRGAKVPPSPAIPERIQERVEERIRERERTREQQMEGIPGEAMSVTLGIAAGVSHQYGFDATGEM